MKESTKRNVEALRKKLEITEMERVWIRKARFSFPKVNNGDAGKYGWFPTYIDDEGVKHISSKPKYRPLTGVIISGN